MYIQEYWNTSYYEMNVYLVYLGTNGNCKSCLNKYSLDSNVISGTFNLAFEWFLDHKFNFEVVKLCIYMCKVMYCTQS